MSQNIRFTYNWNNKLSCKVFSTLRLQNWIEEGKKYSIFLKDVYQFDAECVRKTYYLLNELPEELCWLDTGYNGTETKKILKKMYPNADWTREMLILHLFVKEK